MKERKGPPRDDDRYRRARNQARPPADPESETDVDGIGFVLASGTSDADSGAEGGGVLISRGAPGTE